MRNRWLEEWRAAVDERERKRRKKAGLTTLEDYTDPRRLYGSKEVLSRVMEDTSQFGDVEDMSSTPLSETSNG